jgi:hypothetical protein
MHVLNETPFEVCALPLLAQDDAQHVMVAAKGTFAIPAARRPLELVDEQSPLHLKDVYWGEPNDSSLKYEADTALRKPGTDVALIGSAHSPAAPATQLDVGIRIGHLQKIVRVFGNRYWRKIDGGRWVLSRPEPFQSLPLLYENAYGGADPSSGLRYETNPVGKGFVGDEGPGGADIFPAPNIERPDQLIVRLEDRPEPAGFGFIARHWMPRRPLCGTYDEAWAEERSPLLPADFDERSQSAASPGLRTDTFLEGGEPVVVVNASAAGRLEFSLPARRLGVAALVAGQRTVHDMHLDTVVIEPDAGRATLTWRTDIPCHWNLAMVEWVKITELV